jgi:lipopolysaccharide cholinephosphotransferase
MVKFHTYCEKNDLCYCVAYGTLLGAVRHKGFIPWDNDIDITMPRADFERFLEMVKQKPVASDLGVLHYTTDSEYHYNVIRVYDKNTHISIPYLSEYPKDTGLWIDVFPVDACNRSLRYQGARLGLALNKIFQRADLYAFRGGHGWKRSILYAIHKLFPNKNNRHMHRIDEHAQSIPLAEAEYLSDTIERGAVHMVYPNDQFERLVLLDFEGVPLWAPDDYTGVLEKTYGPTWTELPPENKRETHEILVERRSVGTSPGDTAS